MRTEGKVLVTGGTGFIVTLGPTCRGQVADEATPRITPLPEAIRITYEWLRRVRKEQTCVSHVDRAA